MIKIKRESHLRSILKAITWRIWATATTFILALIVFKDTPNAIEKSSIVAGLEMILKLLFYYLHERLWQNIPFNQSKDVPEVKG